MPEIREREVAIVYWSFKTLSCYCEEVCDKCNGPKSPTLPSDGNFTGKIGISTILHLYVSAQHVSSDCDHVSTLAERNYVVDHCGFYKCPSKFSCRVCHGRRTPFANNPQNVLWQLDNLLFNR